MHKAQPSMRLRPRRGAFTLLELLVVVVVISLLMSLLLVAFGGVRQRAREAKANQLVQSVKVAVLAYREQFGRLPPEVGPSGLPRGWPAGFAGNAEQDWDYDYDQTSPDFGEWRRASTLVESEEATPGSDFTIPMHLVGRGVKVGGSTGPEIDGVAGPGLRQPSVSGGYFWNGRSDFEPPARGRVYEPFVSTRDEDAFLQTDDIASGPASGQRATLVVDPFGTAIRYYNFENPDFALSDPAKMDAARRFSLMSAQDMESLPGGLVGDPQDLLDEPELVPLDYRNLGFAIVAAGPDGVAGYWNQQVNGEYLSADQAALARNDNLVETGQ